MLGKFVHKQTRNRYSIQRIVDKWRVTIAIILLLLEDYALQHRPRQFLVSLYLMLTRPIACSSYWRQKTRRFGGKSILPANTPPHLITLDSQSSFFFGQTSTALGTALYKVLTYVCNHCSDTPVTLTIPAKDTLSSNSLSIKSLVSCPITFFVRFSTNCLPQSLHLKFWLPLWMNPFLTIQFD